MSRAVTVLGHRRPAYLRRTLDALASCRGVDGWRVVVVLDRPDQETRSVASLAAASQGWELALLNLANFEDPPYARIARATLAAFSLGFAASDFVAHLEEDVEPAPDFLEFMAIADRAYAADPDAAVSAVSAWWPAPPEWRRGVPDWALHKIAVDPVPPDGIGTWGVGTWWDRWPTVRAGWDPAHWDFSVVRHGPVAHPLVSRVRNIGRVGTQPSEEWDRRMRDQTPAFSGDVLDAASGSRSG